MVKMSRNQKIKKIKSNMKKGKKPMLMKDNPYTKGK